MSLCQKRKRRRRLRLFSSDDDDVADDKKDLKEEEEEDLFEIDAINLEIRDASWRWCDAKMCREANNDFRRRRRRRDGRARTRRCTGNRGNDGREKMRSSTRRRFQTRRPRTEKKTTTTTTRPREIFKRYAADEKRRSEKGDEQTLAFEQILQKADEETRSTCTFQPKTIAKGYLEEDSNEERHDENVCSNRG